MKLNAAETRQLSMDAKPSIKIQRILNCWTDCFHALMLDGFSREEAANIVTGVFRERFAAKT